MKKMSSVLLALLLCGMAILGAACGKQETPAPDTTAGTEPAATEPVAEPPSDLALVADGATSFVLVRPEDGSSAETEVALLVRKYFEACGLKIKITTDWEGNGVAEQEIIVGDSTRLAEAGLEIALLADGMRIEDVPLLRGAQRPADDDLMLGDVVALPVGCDPDIDAAGGQILAQHHRRLGLGL